MGQLPCPHCGTKPLTSLATAPYARGFLIAYQLGSKKIVGCTGCVANGLRLEALRSVLYGWFSITALILNFVFVPWNILRSFFVKENPEAVANFLDRIGIPQPGQDHRFEEALYSTAAALIHADNKVEEAEVVAAKTLGPGILPEFDPQKFDQIIEDKWRLPDLESVGAILNTYLSEEGKVVVVHYLIEIALADGEFHKSEDRLIAKLAKRFGISDSTYADYRAAILAKANMN